MAESLEDLAQVFKEKTDLLNSGLELRNLTYESRPTLQTLDETLVTLRQTFSEIKAEIYNVKNDLKLAQNLLSAVKVIKDKVAYAAENRPSGWEVQKCAVLMSKKSDSSAASTAHPVGKKNKLPKLPSKISVTLAEYDSVPRYLRGRLPYSSFETFVRAFNKTIAEKYAFLSIPRNHMDAPKDLRKLHYFRKQETTETKGVHFCVMEDLKTYANIKPDPSTRTMLTILRHCARIKEVRGPGSICRYAIRSD